MSFMYLFGCDSSGKWVISIVEGKESRAEVNVGFTNRWGWRDRKYALQGNKHSGTLKLKLHMKQPSSGLIVCDSPFCRPYKYAIAIQRTICHICSMNVATSCESF